MTAAPEIADLQEQLDAALKADPAELARLMVAQLDVALHGSTWARAAPPRAVWLELLAEVQWITRREGIR